MTPDETIEMYLVANRDGTCLTPEGLDRIWPIDNESEPLAVSKAHALPPTCEPGTPTFEEQVGREPLIGFIFNGPTHEQPPEVPLPGGLFLLLTGILVGAAIHKLFTEGD